MINTSELRIGNWVIFKPDNSHQVIDHVSLSGTIGLQGNAVLNTDQLIDPIPLTPDVLVKCGFVKSVSDWDNKSPTWVNKITLYDHENGTYSLYRYNDWKVFVDALHDLQNLYRSITGTELKYKP